MALSRTGRMRRQRLFLEALLSGHSVVDASVRSRVTRSTLYFWRQTDAAFRAAWDDAARSGADAAAEILDGEMTRRAVDGVNESVFYRGEIVATRKRYSDTLLMSAIRDLRERREAAAARSTSTPDAEPEPKITVVVRRFSFPSDQTAKTDGDE